jgi:transcriptional regulator with XRE-family HTH domain
VAWFTASERSNQLGTVRDAYTEIWQDAFMNDNPASHFGRQLKKERVARGWTLDDLARETGVSAAHLSRIETGARPPTKQTAAACDRAFPARKGWFCEYYFDLQRWSEVPSWFKPWSEHELNSKTLRAWSPGNLHGLLQTERYATALNAVEPRVTPDQVADRVANRMARQQRVLFRDDPPEAYFLVSITSLRNMPADIAGGQLRHLLQVAQLPRVTIQVVPECWHAGLPAGFIVADSAAYTESLIAGQVYGDDETVSAFGARFDSIRAEALRASETLTLIREMINRGRLAKVQLLKRPGRRLRRDSLR